MTGSMCKKASKIKQARIVINPHARLTGHNLTRHSSTVPVILSWKLKSK